MAPKEKCWLMIYATQHTTQILTRIKGASLTEVTSLYCSTSERNQTKSFNFANGAGGKLSSIWHYLNLSSLDSKESGIYLRLLQLREHLKWVAMSLSVMFNKTRNHIKLLYNQPQKVSFYLSKQGTNTRVCVCVCTEYRKK